MAAQAEFASKVVLITGGSKGIGLACARLFLAQGATVALASRSADNLKAAQQALKDTGGTVHAIEADLRQPDDAQRMFDETVRLAGVPDVLVNSAGAARRTPVFELTMQAWKDAMDAKFFTYVNAMMACLPAMAQAGRGAVVNVIGMGGKIASPTHIAGGSANAALMLATAGLANGYAAKGIRVNSVNPGITLTERMREGLQAQARHEGISEEEAMRRAVAKLPMGRIVSAEEVGEVVLFLASQRSSYINGANVPVDGAMYGSIV